MRGIIVLAASLCVWSVALGQEPIRTTGADWSVAPTQAAFLDAYPPEAAKNGVRGSATVNCRVQSDGRLDDCTVVTETPNGQGFGAAVVSLAKQSRLKPAFVTKHGVGSTVQLPKSFGPSDLFDAKPDWLKKPTADQLHAVWPTKAMKSGLSGEAIISCKVTTAGALEACKVRSEKPEGAGFGDAALLLAPSFRMKPAMRDGQPTVSSVAIPITFSNPSASRTGADLDDTNSIRLVPNAPFDRTPSYADLVAAWPANTPDAVNDGKASMRCRLLESGLLGDCDFAFVSSPRFERPARDLAKKFHVRMGEGLNKAEIARVYIALSIQFVSPARADASRNISHAVWTGALDAQQVEKLYPAAAVDQGVKSGKAVVACTVREDGGLDACATASEAPASVGFGVAAIEVAKLMKMTLWGEDGLPTAGRSIRLPLIFDQPQTAAARP